MLAVAFALQLLIGLCCMVALGGLVMGALISRRAGSFPGDIRQTIIFVVGVGAAAAVAWLAIATFA